MRAVTKTYNIREKGILHDGMAFLIPLTFSNRKDHIGELNYTSVLYASRTRTMFTPEASRNRKYQIRQ